LVDDIISMGHKLDLKVVAEGVELEEEKQYLIKYRCDAVQGYLYSKSVIEKEAIELLKKEGQS
jgi:EAL domain-containing protein (putative c-di-GMP-specific phosphodiesterase class I)